MNEYNERLLKNVLEDLREEQDEELLKEFEEAKNDPEFQVKEGEAEAFAKKYVKKQKKSTQKLIAKVAAVLIVLAIGFATVVPLPVQGQKRTVAELIANFVNSEFVAIGNENLLLTYEGEYIPTFIPEGYEVDSVSNLNERKQIIFVNSEKKTISFIEYPSSVKINIDNENSDSVTKIEVNGYDSILIKKDGIYTVILATNDSTLYISSNDTELDLIGFAKKIEKR